MPRMIGTLNPAQLDALRVCLRDILGTSHETQAVPELERFAPPRMVNAIVRYGEMARALATVAAEPDAGWQPIATAPKDGPPVIVTDGERSALAHVLVDGWAQFISGTPMLFQPKLPWKPTHWMSMPATPAATTGVR